MTIQNALSHVLATLDSISAKARDLNGKYGLMESSGQDAVPEKKPAYKRIDVRV
jgi:hypothetical protein